MNGPSTKQTDTPQMLTYPMPNLELLGTLKNPMKHPKSTESTVKETEPEDVGTWASREDWKPNQAVLQIVEFGSP